MNKTKIAILGIVVLFAVLSVSTASADVTTLYFNPENSNVLGYGETVEVEVRADAPYGINNGQIGIDYNPSCAKVVAVEFNPAWWMTSWNVSTQSECWGPGRDWIKYWRNPDLGPGDVWLFTITIKGNSTEYCKTNLSFGPGLTGAPPCHITVGNHSGGHLEFVTINGTFECGTPPTFEKELVEGWNLISLPLTNTTNMTVANIIDKSLSGKYDALYRYDAVNKSWVAVGSCDVMENGVGYFIHMTAAGTWNYSGAPYESIDINLEKGLNCIGWVNETGSALPDALNSITGKYNYVARWNATSQSFEVYEPHAPDVFNDFWTMDRGEGYWIAAKEDCTLSYTMP